MQNPLNFYISAVHSATISLILAGKTAKPNLLFNVNKNMNSQSWSKNFNFVQIFLVLSIQK